MRKDTKAQDFPRNVKKEIAERDEIQGWPCCVWCGLAAPERIAWSNAHYIPRSHGGLGIDRNGLTLCPICHARYDQSIYRKEMREYFRAYLQEKYENWDEDELVYRKGHGYESM
jgi:hypothetical protein